MPYLLALDQSATSIRSIIFDERGQSISVAEKTLPQLHPLPGWAEQDPVGIWQAQLTTLREALAYARLTATDIHAIGISTPSASTVVWNRSTGQPIYNAITGQDQRGESDRSRQQWILDHVYNAHTQAEAGELIFGTLGSWLLWQLTGHTDTNGATHTLGTTRPEILGASIPIMAMADSSQTIIFGLACFSPEIATLTYGNGNGSDNLLHLHTGQETRFPSLLSPNQCTGNDWQALAALQSTAFQTTTLLRALERKESQPIQELRVSGPAIGNDTLLQMQADLLGIPVSRPAIAHPSALGAAYLAGLHSGIYRSTDEIKALWKVEKTFIPAMSQDTARQIMAQWEHALLQAI